jgi:hypothetical protein
VALLVVVNFQNWQSLDPADDNLLNPTQRLERVNYDAESCSRATKHAHSFCEEFKDALAIMVAKVKESVHSTVQHKVLFSPQRTSHAPIAQRHFLALQQRCATVIHQERARAALLPCFLHHQRHRHPQRPSKASSSSTHWSANSLVQQQLSAAKTPKPYYIHHLSMS